MIILINNIILWYYLYKISCYKIKMHLIYHLNLEVDFVSYRYNKLY